jgi:hypothetical protein
MVERFSRVPGHSEVTNRKTVLSAAARTHSEAGMQRVTDATELASTAAKLFGKLSRDLSASVSAQAAGIQQFHRAHPQYDIQDMKFALENDMQRIVKIREAANAVHRNHGIDARIETQQVLSIIRSDFDLASRMQVLTDAELHSITDTLYPQYFAVRYPNETRDARLREVVLGMIDHAEKRKKSPKERFKDIVVLLKSRKVQAKSVA